MKNKFKFRSECLHDLIVFQEMLRKKATSRFNFSYEMDAEGFPDCDAEISTDMSIEQLRDILRLVPDGHVMLGSMDYSKKYTGERYFSY
jgi:hypothetical protein